MHDFGHDITTGELGLIEIWPSDQNGWTSEGLIATSSNYSSKGKSRTNYQAAFSARTLLFAYGSQFSGMDQSASEKVVRLNECPYPIDATELTR